MWKGSLIFIDMVAITPDPDIPGLDLNIRLSPYVSPPQDLTSLASAHMGPSSSERMLRMWRRESENVLLSHAHLIATECLCSQYNGHTVSGRQHAELFVTCCTDLVLSNNWFGSLGCFGQKHLTKIFVGLCKCTNSLPLSLSQR